MKTRQPPKQQVISSGVPTRTGFIKYLGVGAFALGLPAIDDLPAEIPEPRPNIVFILTDDQGYGDASAFGHPYLKTPNLDRLRREGRWFQNFYCPSAVCTPSRAGFMTGQFPARHRLHAHIANTNPGLDEARDMASQLDPKATNLARILQNSGYRTAHFGKWHLGYEVPPTEYGFDTAKTAVGPGPALFSFEETGAPHMNHKVTSAIADEAARFIRTAGDKPFFLQVWTTLPHATLDPTPEMLAKYDEMKIDPGHPAFGNWEREYIKKAPDPQKAAKTYYASITDLDEQVGKILDALDEAGQASNTIVIFSSDNGPEDYATHSARNAGFGSPGPFRARKRSHYEGGVRVPLLVRWPGHVPPGSTDSTSLLNAVDFVPTLAALANTKLPPGYQSDGEDFSAALASGAIHQREKPMFWEWLFPVTGNPEQYQPPLLAVRSGKWKLLFNPDGSRTELYDLSSDPEERTNLADKHPDTVADLRTKALAWQGALPPNRHRANWKKPVEGL